MLIPTVVAAVVALTSATIAPIDPKVQEQEPARNEVVSDESIAWAKAFCSALQAHEPGRALPMLAADFRGSGLDGTKDLDGPAFLAALDKHFDRAVLLRRCGFKPFEFLTDLKHARAVGTFIFNLSGTEPGGARFADRGDMKLEFVRDGKTLKLHAAELGPRVWMTGGPPEFLDVTASIGIAPDFAEKGGLQLGSIFGQLENGGLSVVDYDGDGDLDIYVSRNGPNLLYRNDGHGHFTEVGHEAGVDDPGDSRGVLFVDLDNDGKLDLYVANKVSKDSTRGNHLYRNDGNGHFTDVTRGSGADHAGYDTCIVAGDVDNDGLLDLYVCQYESFKTRHSPFDAHNGRGSLLLHNLGGFKFKEMGKAVGVAGKEWSLAAAFADLDGDRKPELIVVNDFGSPRVYHNTSKGPGDVRFEEITKSSGLVDPGNGMGIDIADYDGDGKLDVYLSKMYSKAGNRLLSMNLKVSPEAMAAAKQGARGNSLFHNDGNLHFSEVGAEAGVRRAGWAWSCEFGDVDNDGDLDIYVASGFRTGILEDDL